MHYILAHGGEAISKQLSTSNIYPVMLHYITKYQWHSLALIEIEKIIKMTIHSHSEQLLSALHRSSFLDKLQDMAKMESNQGKFGCGYKGVLVNIAKTLQESLEKTIGYGMWLKKNKKD